MATSDDLAMCRDTRRHRLTRGYRLGVGHPAHDDLWCRLLEEFELLTEWHAIQAAHEADEAVRYLMAVERAGGGDYEPDDAGPLREAWQRQIAHEAEGPVVQGKMALSDGVR